MMDLRYSGQGYELSIEVYAQELERVDLSLLPERFHTKHEKFYGHRAEKQLLEIVNYRVEAIIEVPKVQIDPMPMEQGETKKLVPSGYRQVLFPERPGEVLCPILERQELSPGQLVEGPAIIRQPDSTVAIYPGHTAKVDVFNNLIIFIPVDYRG